jgi:hypothetical protein
VQDPIVESAKKCKKISFGLLELEMADLERFLRKTPLVLYGLSERLVESKVFELTFEFKSLFKHLGKRASFLWIPMVSKNKIFLLS